MPLLITLDDLYRKLSARLKLAGGIATLPQLADVVIPVLDVSEDLKTPRAVFANVNIGAGEATVYTVPGGKRARLKLLFKGTTASAVKFDMANVGAAARWSMFSSQTGEYVDTKLDFPMETGWYLIATQGGAGDTAIYCGVIVEEWDTF